MINLWIELELIYTHDPLILDSKSKLKIPYIEENEFKEIMERILTLEYYLFLLIKSIISRLCLNKPPYPLQDE